MRLLVDHLSRPKDGEVENGDSVVVRRAGDVTLLAVVDALGHGPLAAVVARAASEHLATAPLNVGAATIVEGLHQHLRSSRGAAAMVCRIEGQRIEGCGVGNVELRSYGTPVPAVLTPGVVGRSLTRLRTFGADLRAGDRFVIFSDGISSRFDGAALMRLPASEACRSLLNLHRRAHDDATVLIAHVEA